MGHKDTSANEVATVVGLSGTPHQLWRRRRIREARTLSHEAISGDVETPDSVHRCDNPSVGPGSRSLAHLYGADHGIEGYDACHSHPNLGLGAALGRWTAGDRLVDQ